MSIIDWADPEEMLGLLSEYVRDELQEEAHDRARAAFLRQLAVDVDALCSDEGAETTTARLRDLYESQPGEFADDPVVQHVRDCVLELERIAGH